MSPACARPVTARGVDVVFGFSVGCVATSRWRGSSLAAVAMTAFPARTSAGMRSLGRARHADRRTRTSETISARQAGPNAATTLMVRSAPAPGPESRTGRACRRPRSARRTAADAGESNETSVRPSFPTAHNTLPQGGHRRAARRRENRGSPGRATLRRADRARRRGPPYRSPTAMARVHDQHATVGSRRCTVVDGQPVRPHASGHDQVCKRLSHADRAKPSPRGRAAAQRNPSRSCHPHSPL